MPLPLPQRQALAAEVLRRLAAANPSPETELKYENPYQLAVAVSLSAQCTDVRVNQVTPAFFERFPTPQTLKEASVEEIFEKIKSISYPNNKAKNLKGMAEKLCNDYGGVLPQSIDQLTTLPGVGRKTANVLASVLYDQPAMAVDTHVFRVANRLGLTEANNPLQSEKQLVEIIAQDQIARAHHWLILHGRYVCKARTPQCGVCVLQDLCPAFANGWV